VKRVGMLREPGVYDTFEDFRDKVYNNRIKKNENCGDTQGP